MKVSKYESRVSNSIPRSERPKKLVIKNGRRKRTSGTGGSGRFAVSERV